MKNLIDKAINAHRNTSFSPERRGTQMIADYSNELESDVLELQGQGIDESNIMDYKERYEKYFCSYLNAKANTFSVMITGSGNFPVRRHEKANRSERRHYEIFREWRIRAKKAIIRKSKPEKTFLSELDRYKQELESLKTCHIRNKEANKIIANARKTGEDISDWLIKEFNISPALLQIRKIAGFDTTNVLANIHRVEDRIKLLESKQEKENKEYQYNGFKVIMNYETDRIQILHDSKPSYDIIKDLKSNGFKWAPSVGLWQRQLTGNAIFSTKHMLKSWNVELIS
jgi:hypothetical protein